MFWVGWATRYLDAAPEDEVEPLPEGVARIAETGAGKFQQEVAVGSHMLIADEPKSVGGADTGPTPYDFLGIALGACTAMTLRMYASHKKMKLGPISVDVTHAKVHAEDCKECGEGREGRIDRFRADNFDCRYRTRRADAGQDRRNSRQMPGASHP